MTTTRWIGAIAAAATVALANAQPSARIDYFDVPAGSHPHDVAAVPAPGGPVYFTEQASGKLGVLDPSTGKSLEIPLGQGSAPHGVIVAADGAAWITDGGRNEIVRVAAGTHAITRYALPSSAPDANLNTPTFDRRSRLWFTGQSGYYGRVDLSSGRVDVWRAPGGPGAYGMTTRPSGDVYYASLAGNHIARIDVEAGTATVIEPPTPGQGARRVWSDSKGNIWVSYWNSGKVGRYDPVTRSWREWPLPGHAHAYAVWVDPDDKVWLTDWSTNAIVRFDPATQRFESFPSDRPHANVRELQGRAGEVWGAESGADRLVRISWR
ncbi:MAG TPA: lyase [Casimicrobiaceae bacterium]|nr:lyase [Casimicrobiaceae bacterium]